MATSTAGPASHQRPASSWVTVSRPPATSTVTTPVASPASRRATAPTASAPEPQDSVSPEPRSKTRMATCRSATAATNSTFTPEENRTGSKPGGAERSSESSATPSCRAQTRCGLPQSTATPGKVSWPTVAVLAAYTRGVVMCTRISSPSTTATTTPARVATGRPSGPGVASPLDTRYRVKTRTPLPHISAIEPSLLR